MSSAKIVDLRPGRSPSRSRQSQPSLFSQKPPKKPMPLRAKRRRVRVIQIFAVLVLLAGAAWGVHLASYLPTLSISTIRVSGVQKLPPEVVQTYVESELYNGSYQFLSRANIFVYPRAVVEHGIESSFPRVRSASVSRPAFFSTELDVAITERSPYAAWCAGEHCYQMDEGGFIFADASTSVPVRYEEQYEFSGGVASTTEPIGQTFVPGKMPALLALLTIVQQQTGLTPGSIFVADEKDFSIRFAEGFDVRASFGADASTVARNLKLVLSSKELAGKQQDLDYVDLRFGNRVFYKMKGQDQQESSQQ